MICVGHYFESGDFSFTTSSIDEIAFRTQSGHSHKTFPVPTPLSSMQIVAPLFSRNFSRIFREYFGTDFPPVKIPATITAPITAPQVLSIPPIPAANPDASFISSSSGTGILSSKTFKTAWVQLHFPLALSPAAVSILSSSVNFCASCKNYIIKSFSFLTS